MSKYYYKINRGKFLLLIKKNIDLKKIFILIMFIFLPFINLYAEDNSEKFGFDFAVGGIIMPIDYYVSDTNDLSELDFQAYYTFSGCVTYDIIEWFTIGGWFGYFHNSPYLEAAIRDGILPLSMPFTYGIKLILGNKEKLAFSANLGITPSIGLFINNIILNVFWGGSTTILIRTFDEYGTPIGGEEKTYIFPYLEIGYHWDIEKMHKY